MSDKLLTVSLKGASQNQPWVVINADSADELRDALADLSEQNVYQIIADANATYQGVANVANPSGRAPAPAAAGSDEPAQGAETTTPTRQRQAAAAPSSGYGRKKAVAGTGGRGGKKPKLSYEEASADCAHGERRRYTKPDVDWVLYGCPQPKDAPDNCGPNFLDKSDDQEG